MATPRCRSFDSSGIATTPAHGKFATSSSAVSSNLSGSSSRPRRIAAAMSDLKSVNLPVVELPDGTRLFGPTLRDVADRLGFVTKPRLRQYDVSIYGAGPAGLSAALYAASEGLSTVLIERSAVGGQAGTTSMIENYMGFPKGINGADLAERARQQAVKFGVELLMMREGVKSTFHDDRIWTDLADGGRWLPAPMSAPPAWSGVVSTCPTRMICLDAGSTMVREPARRRCAAARMSMWSAAAIPRVRP
jgi:hypothetical protein